MDNSDDDILEIESSEDGFYNDEGFDLDYGIAEETSKRSQVNYVVLNEDDIRKHQRDDIERISTVLSLSQVEAIVLLLYYQWSVSKVEDEWFTDEDRVRKAAGILKEPVFHLSREVNIECGICFDLFLEKEIKTVSCGHPYCITCWTGYMTSKINEGPGCLLVKCPEPSCSAVVGQDMVDNLITKVEDKEKYSRFFFRSYVEASGKKMKWCPSPGCEYAVDFRSGVSENYDVSCLCSYEFCWNCSEDSHRPVDCDTVSKWNFKNNDESENTNWILTNTKPCPNCKRQIEKNQGCNHMRCSICKTSFCWLCLGSLSATNYLHQNCHKFKGKDKEDEDKRIMAKNAIDRYTHYYERWASNQSSRLKAMEDLETLKSVQLKVLSYKQSTPETQLQFIVDAWLQIIECRRVLKWTYAYGYYLPEQQCAKKQLFEFLQGEAEVGLERLHHCAEMELKEFVSGTGTDKDSSKDFDEFRRKIIGLTTVTKTYFKNLVKALENGLDDVENNESSSKTTTYPESSSKRQKVGGKGPRRIQKKR